MEVNSDVDLKEDGITNIDVKDTKEVGITDDCNVLGGVRSDSPGQAIPNFSFLPDFPEQHRSTIINCELMKEDPKVELKRIFEIIFSYQTRAQFSDSFTSTSDSVGHDELRRWSSAYKAHNDENICESKALLAILKAHSRRLQRSKKRLSSNMIDSLCELSPTIKSHRLNSPSSKKLLIFDLNKVLLYRYPKTSNFVLRPFAKQFIEAMSKIYFVGTWTSLKRKYGKSIVHSVFEGVDLHLEWYQSMCDPFPELIADSEIESKITFRKSLSKVWSSFPEFNAANTMLMDDSVEKCITNASATVVHPRPFLIKSNSDRSYCTSPMTTIHSTSAINERHEVVGISSCGRCEEDCIADIDVKVTKEIRVTNDCDVKSGVRSDSPGQVMTQSHAHSHPRLYELSNPCDMHDDRELAPEGRLWNYLVAVASMSPDEFSTREPYKFS